MLCLLLPTKAKGAVARWKSLVAKFALKKCKVEPLLRGVSLVKQEVPVHVKQARAVTVFCSQGHDLVRIPVLPKQVESKRCKLYVSWQQVRCDKCGSEAADVSFVVIRVITTCVRRVLVLQSSSVSRMVSFCTEKD